MKTIKSTTKQLINKHLILYILASLVNSIVCEGNNNVNKVLKDSVYASTIQTVLLHKKNDQLSNPIIRLGFGERLTLSFDEFSDEVNDYQYDFIHCDENWYPTDISKTEYIEGFNPNPVENYKFSFNTFRNYIHYNLNFPNNDVKLNLSGNYIIKVFKDYIEDSIILTRRFYIVDHKVDIEAEIKKPIQSEYFDKGQQVSFKVITSSYYIQDPFSDLHIKIRQNNRQDNMITGIKPLFISSKELSYDYHDKNIFWGGTEFRYFNIKSMRYHSEFINKIEYKAPYYHVELRKDPTKTFDKYFFNDDINGKFLIDVQEGQNSETDADYAYVHFSLPFDAPMIDGDIYIIGALTNWKLSKKGKMNYNFEEKAYEKTLLLKQGYYNYLYAFLLDGEKKGDITFIEGSHHQAENDYEIFIYHHKPGTRYTELIGYKKLNSIKVID